MDRRVEKWAAARRASAGLAGLIQVSATTQMTAYRLDLFINILFANENLAQKDDVLR